MIFSYILLISASIIHSIGEFLYKKGSEHVFNLNLEETNLFSKLLKMSTRFFSLIIIVSLFLSLVAKIVFGISLSTIPLSVGSPLYLSLIVLFSTIIGFIVLKEELNFSRIIGLVFICIGIFLVIL